MVSRQWRAGGGKLGDDRQQGGRVSRLAIRARKGFFFLLYMTLIGPPKMGQVHVLVYTLQVTCQSLCIRPSEKEFLV